MLKINKKIKVGTRVLLICDPEQNILREVIEINDTRVNLKVKCLAGSFQRGHIKRFTNKEQVTACP